MLLIFAVNMHGLPLKDKKGIKITNAFQKMNLIVNQTKYGWIKVVNFTIDQLNRGCRIMM